MKLLLVIIFILCTQNLSAQPLLNITFQDDEVGKFPSGWTSRDQNDAPKVYSVQAEGEKRFLHADARGLSVQIGYEKEWDLKNYPILRWRWRAVTFPAGSNERVKSGGDSVLGLYVVLRGLPFVKAIKYIWSDTLPVGMVFDSPYSSGTKIVVVQSGRVLAGALVAEERNALSDYERFFGTKEERPMARGIAILTDSDNTNSRAVGDYADIEILANNGK